MKLSTYENLRLPNFSVHALCEVLEDAGLDWRSALLRAELSAEAAERLGGTVPGKKELAFQLQFAALTEHRPDPWLKAAQRYTPSAFGVRSLALLSAPTIQAFLEVTIDATDVGPAILDVTPLRTREGVMQGIAITYPEVPDALIPFSLYRELTFIVRTLSWLYGRPFPFTRIEFPLDDIAPEAAAMVSCPIDCASDELRLWWEPTAATTALPFGDAFQHATFLKRDAFVLDSLRATGDWVAIVARMSRAAPELNRKLENTAASLKVSPRSLQRRLAQNGTDFGTIRDATLNNLAIELLLQTDRSVASIARTLGYADPAGFSTAFKRWTGVPPSTFRSAGLPAQVG